jgi:D-aminoacyl-tRNA deacylase
MEGWQYVKPRLGHIKVVSPSRETMPSQSVVLIAVNSKDIASTNQADALRLLDAWQVADAFEGHPTYAFQHARMIYLPDGLLFEDHLDKRWEQHSGELVSEVIFPSRHVAASGQASLTLHPIGVPHLPLNEVGQYGGRGGHAPPPSSRLAPWWKLLHAHAATDSSVNGFDLSLEVTHHGPYLETPCLFIEVGSTEDTWGHVGAANVLATVMREGLFEQQSGGCWDEKQHVGELVVITLGGGHYAPRANLLGQLDGVWLGHMLATYALPFEQTENGVGGAWAQAMDAAIRTTRQTFPGGVLVCSMDKKAFRGWQRQAIRDYLEERSIPLLTTKQIKERLGA